MTSLLFGDISAVLWVLVWTSEEHQELLSTVEIWATQDSPAASSLVWMSEMCFHRVIVSSPPHYLPGMQDWGCLATERKKGTGVRAAGVQCIKLRHIDRDSHRLKRTSSGWHTAAAWADVNHAVLTFTPLHRLWQTDSIRCSSGEVCRRAQEF